VIYQNFQNTRHFSSPSSYRRLGRSLVCDVSWGINFRTERCRETTERKKSLSSMFPISVLLPIDIFADFKCFLSLKVNERDFKATHFIWTPVDRTSVSKVKQLASRADVTTILDFRPPFTRPWTETSQFQTFTDLWGFDGSTWFNLILFSISKEKHRRLTSFYFRDVSKLSKPHYQVMNN